jgi:hypothetical protein
MPPLVVTRPVAVRCLVPASSLTLKNRHRRPINYTHLLIVFTSFSNISNTIRPVPASAGQPHHIPTGNPMKLEDLILVSVDDHAIEPRNAFTRHMPAKYKGASPRSCKGGP